MSSQNIDKVVKLACKPKNAPPKPKYVDVLVAATYSDDGSLGTACSSLAMRLREQNGVALLTLHQMIRSGSTDQLLDHLVKSQSLRLQNLGDQNFEGYRPPTSMAAYGEYIDVRIRAFKDLKHDLVRVQTESNRRSDGLGAGSKARRLRHLAVDKGLLREVKAVQRILDSLIRCRFYDDDLKDENTILAFRMLIKDLLVLFQAGNEGVCNILEHYFEMSKPDATEAFDIYKSFIKQTDKIVDYLGIARKLQNVVNVPVPNLKHAPTGLVKALEEYLNDPNFEDNRREYRKSLGVVEGRGSARTPSPAPPAATQSQTTKAAAPASTTSAPTQASSSAPAPPAGSSQKIQDFFDSIQTDSQPTMFGGPPQQMNYQQMQQPAFNPFRQSMMMPQQTGFMPPQMTGFPGGMPQQQFLQPQQTGAMAFGNQQPMFPQPQQQSQPFQPSPQQPFMQPTQTGFQPNQTGMQPQQTGFLQPQATGPNPFRQSMMVNTNNLGGAFSQPTSPFGQSSSPSLPSQIQRPGSTPANPLVSQPTGSKNPFAPAPGKAATVSSRGPTMNELAMGFGRDQGQQQSQAQNQTQSPWATMNGKPSNGTGIADVASSFVFNDSNNNKSNTNQNDDFMAQFGGLSVNTSSTGPSSSTNNSQSSPFGQFNPSSAFGGSGSQNQSSTEFLQPQQTGYGGSTVKPFKPTSSFGSQLVDGLGPVASPAHSPGVAASPQAPSGGIQSQMTGFPGMGQQSTGAGAGSGSGGMGQFGAFGGNNTGGGMMSQNTGMANPFRANTMPTGGGGGGMGNLPFGQAQNPGAFGANSPFAGQNQQGQGQGQGQGQNFGQGFGGQQGGSLI